MSDGITIIKPLAITPAMLVSTDVAEADYSAYSAGTTYALGDRVMDNHLIYQSLVAGNLGNTPSASPAKWVLVSATNRWKLFDTVSSSQTAQATSMTYSVRPATVVTGIAAVNMTGVTSIRVRMVSDAYGTVYDKTVTRSRPPPSSGWWSWFFGRRTDPISSHFDDLPSFADSVITVDFAGLSNMAVGSLLIGTVSRWGMGIQYGMSMGIRDYSIKQTNEWGDTILTQRAYADRDKFSLTVQRGDVKSLRSYLAGLRATPCLWITPDDILYGYYQDFEILISYSTVCDCDITLEGLT
ncbi:MAG: carbohydrate-binding protein [Rhodoferax sp.]|nr:MAG: carbohydrate-binding protein [Rhodoferax sp.]